MILLVLKTVFFLLNFTSINEIKKAEPEIKVWLYTTDNDNK